MCSSDLDCFIVVFFAWVVSKISVLIKVKGPATNFIELFHDVLLTTVSYVY